MIRAPPKSVLVMQFRTETEAPFLWDARTESESFRFVWPNDVFARRTYFRFWQSDRIAEENESTLGLWPPCVCRFCCSGGMIASGALDCDVQVLHAAPRWRLYVTRGFRFANMMAHLVGNATPGEGMEAR